MMNCNLCGRRVAENFESKWKHLVKWHPEQVALKMLPLVFGLAETARTIGAEIAKAAKLPRVE